VTQSPSEAAAGAEQRFGAYLDDLAAAFGHADRRTPVRQYCTGLLLPGERKSVEPMAARLAPRAVRATHQSMHHLVATAPWDDTAVLAAVRDAVLPTLETHGPLEAWIIDDTAIPKKGRHSVGVARQWCGQRGKQDNCQAAVSLSVASRAASLPVAYQLYLPEEWADDPERRERAGVPADVAFRPKQAIALAQVEATLEAEVPRGVVLADAAYGSDTAFRDQLTAWDLRYAVGIRGNVTVWPAGTGPLPAPPYAGFGRPATRLRRDAAHQPVAVAQLALDLPARAYRTVTWREGTRGLMRSRFARVRVRPAHRDYHRHEPRAEEWLLIEWPADEEEPTKYWLSTLPARVSRRELVDTAKLRWRVERDYQELKQELGLGQFEGRGWRGFHHHATLCIAAYGFLVAERLAFPPSSLVAWREHAAPPIPRRARPRGAAPPRRAS
jgi:SRSO17 transposase